MARLKLEGIDVIIQELDAMGEEAKRVQDDMLIAAADVTVDIWKDEAERRKYRDTGAMIESIGHTRKPRTVSGVRKIDIYPQGTDKKGTRNAEKAYYLHYGTGRINASHWVDDVIEQADAKAFEAMEKKFDKFIKERS